MKSGSEILEVDGFDVTVTNPAKVYFPRTGHTKLDLVRYYLSVAGGALTAVGDRPMALKRYVNGIDKEAFFQKRAPEKRPEWIETVELKYPSGRSAHEIVVREAAQLAWVVNLGCVDLHPHSVRAADVHHPDELRVDLDPVPGVPWSMVRDVALVAREVLADHGLTGWPKTTGSRGFHIYCRIAPAWTFRQVHRAAAALAREIAERAPDIATARWWKEERHGVFVDYNQNAKDRTTAAGYSVRPTQDARVSATLSWDEVPDCDPADFTIDTMPARYASIGDPWAGIDDTAGSLDSLLELADRQKDDPSPEGEVAPSAPGKSYGASGRRRTSAALIEISRARTREEALEGLERWKVRHPGIVERLEPAEILVDAMRGRSTAWYRVRLNVTNIPADERPAQEELEVDYDPFEGWSGPPGAQPRGE
ncbi:DNA polymerase domain-containing protein [Virgisporangium aurantiacum]|uniref:DNA polymerase domain-containing protein n=1 Tax=Virgisporangium aurantiacum TaxID=175570 RepID=A0A8J4DWS4_9ACTN|nr:DNA polymerase domain-containing protein [Virgisporangium aurantiacum]GIJ52588.1 DNA polymerase domain-containing protein [Virgisporangium aurantiacum]